MCLRCEPLKLKPTTLFALDKKEPSPKSVWIRARKSERMYASRLLHVARYIDDLVKMLWRPDEPWQSSFVLQESLHRYAQTIEPWAAAVAERMITEVAARDKHAWKTVGAQIGRALHREIEEAPIGDIMRDRMAEQVGLIKSIPIEAAERVHRLTMEGISDGTRAKETAARIMETGGVSKLRAKLIALTETSRTATELVQARASYIGADSYMWRMTGDGRVRSDHRALNGKIFQ